MNMTPKKNYLLRKFLLFIVGTLFIAAFIGMGVYAANLHNDTPDPFSPYDPATFGIPEIVAGYRILAIKSADNTACMPDNFHDVLVQAVDLMPDNPLVAQGNGDVIFELKKLNPNVRWGLGGMMPVTFDRTQFLSLQDNWNRSMENGCINIGVPIILVTDTPDPFAPYDPLTFGIPEIVAGYRIVAVHTLENTACMPVDYIRVTIQAVEPSADNPMVPVGGGDIIFELKKIKPDVQWQLEYIMPGPVNREQLVTSMAQWNEVMKNGCHQLGGPEFTVTPDV